MLLIIYLTYNFMTKLKDVKEAFSKYAVIKDKYIIDVLMCNIVCNNILKDDVVWLMLIAKSSGGKSLMLNPFKDCGAITHVDDLTPNSFLSGYGGKNQKVGKESPSLLKQMNDGTFIISDFTSIIDKDEAVLSAIFGDFRTMHDGSTSKAKGTGTMNWAGRIGMICASTPRIYKGMEKHRSSGERFLYYVMNQPTDKEVAMKLRSVTTNSKMINTIMQGHYKAYLYSLNEFLNQHGIREPEYTEAQNDKIDFAVNFLISGKATVHTDFKNLPDEMPQKAGPARDRKMFTAYIKGFLNMYNYEDNTPENTLVPDFVVDDIINKMSYSAINQERRKVLETLALTPASRPRLSASEIGASEGFGMEKQNVIKIVCWIDRRTSAKHTRLYRHRR
jgi:hypothetical protein